MKDILFVLAALCCSGMALANYHDDGYEEPQKDYYDCSLNVEVKSTKTFYSRDDAEKWCKPFGKNCTVKRGLYYDYDAIFYRAYTIKDRSYDSYKHAREKIQSNLFILFEANRYYRNGFVSYSKYDKCW